MEEDGGEGKEGGRRGGWLWEEDRNREEKEGETKEEGRKDEGQREEERND